MAYAFTSAASANIQGTYTSHLGLPKFTMSMWSRRGTSGTQQGWGFGATPGGTNRTHVTHFTDDVLYFPISTSSSVNGNTAQNITGWNHILMVFDGAQSTNAARVIAYVNGAQKTLTFNGTIPSALSTNSNNNQLNIGRNAPNDIYSNGDFAEYATWEDALTADEAVSLAKGFKPWKIRPAKMLSYIPLVRNLADVRSATSLTNTAATVADHPRVY